jgi:hypothetical protein
MRPLLLTALLSVLAAPAHAWPEILVQALNRDAWRLVPRSLGRLLAERETKVLDETRRFPPALGQALAQDLQQGRLSPETLAAIEAETAQPVELLRRPEVNEGLARLGGLLRIPADLADPVLTAGAEGLPPGVAREYYAFVEENLDKIPVVLEDPAALRLSRRDLPAYWQRLIERSRPQAAVIRGELWKKGRLVDHRTLDYRSPVYGVASLSYSRAVNGIAATWLALWRDARGDVTRMPQPKEVTPRDTSPNLARSPRPEDQRP